MVRAIRSACLQDGVLGVDYADGHRLGISGTSKDCVFKLAEHLARPHAVVGLDFKDNKMGPGMGDSFDACLQAFPALEAVSLENNRLGPQGGWDRVQPSLQWSPPPVWKQTGRRPAPPPCSE